MFTQPDPRQAVAHMIELVLTISGPADSAQPALQRLRLLLSREAEGPFAGEVGAHVSQQDGELTCTLRIVIDAHDLLGAVDLAVRGLRPVLVLAHVGEDGVVFRETAVHARCL